MGEQTDGYVVSTDNASIALMSQRFAFKMTWTRRHSRQCRLKTQTILNNLSIVSLP